MEALGPIAPREVVFLRGGATLVFRDNGRVETRKGTRVEQRPRSGSGRGLEGRFVPHVVD